MDKVLIRKLYEIDKDLRHKLYQMDKDLIVQLYEIENTYVFRHEFVMFADEGFNPMVEIALKKNGEFSVRCGPHPTTGIFEWPHNKFIRFNIIFNDDIRPKIWDVINSFDMTHWPHEHKECNFIKRIEEVVRFLKTYEEKFIKGEEKSSPTFCWFRESRIKRAKDELILELVSTAEENKRLTAEIKRLTLAKTAEIQKLAALLNTERAASKRIAECNFKLKKENDEMTEKLGIIHQKFQLIKANLCKR